MDWQHMREVAGTTLAAFGLKVLAHPPPGSSAAI